MRFSFAFALLATSQGITAFSPVAPRWGSSIALHSSVETQETSAEPVAKAEAAEPVVEKKDSTLEPKPLSSGVVPLTEAEINARFSMQMEKLQEKDRSSLQLSKEVSDTHHISIRPESV